MSELVANLRSYATKYANDYGYCVASDLDKAADRIEALEAALRELLELHESDHQTDNDAAIIDFIRAALASEQK